MVNTSAIAQLIVSVGAGAMGAYFVWAAIGFHILSNGFTGRSTVATPVFTVLALGCAYLAYLFWPLAFIVKVS